MEARGLHPLAREARELPYLVVQAKGHHPLLGEAKDLLAPLGCGKRVKESDETNTLLR
jgi:hypothetical protein